MTNPNERVLAYSLAKTIAKNHLNNISTPGAQLTSQHTMQTTGGMGHGVDAQYDISMDW